MHLHFFFNIFVKKLMSHHNISDRNASKDGELTMPAE